MSVRVRFAPSPTGYLHIGGVRTALFNWLFARHHQGKFVLRIEDTDKSRSTEDSIREIIAGMKWLGLDWDEGPYRQTERQAIYEEQAEKLLKEGKAYRCYCTPEELEERRKLAMSKGEKPLYDRRCRELTNPIADKPFSLRFKTPLEGKIVINDILRGEIIFENKELDDLIIFRSDRTPTYNFCVVIDDATMGISHVIRGDDHLTNTPRQAHLYQGLGYPIPKFAHVSMILGNDKTRLSKRHGATSILAYRDEGFLPEAMVNYLVRLGWSHGDQEIFSMKELIEHFSLEHVGKSAAVFNPEKLTWLNSQYIKKAEPAVLAPLLKDLLVKNGLDAAVLDLPVLEKIVPLFKERAKTLKEMAEGAEFFFREELTYDPTAREKFLTKENLSLLNKTANLLSSLNTFEENSIKEALTQFITTAGIKLGDIAQPIRVALSGKSVSPGIFEVMVILGKDKVIQRIRKAVELG